MNILERLIQIYKKLVSEEFWYPNEKVIDVKSKKLNTEKSSLDLKPAGYIDLYLSNIGLDELYTNHNVTLSYIKHGTKHYVSTINLHKSGRVLECYSNGENLSLTIFEESKTKLNLIIKEVDGGVEIKQIINGLLVS